jgi:putative membrane protein
MNARCISCLLGFAISAAAPVAVAQSSPDMPAPPARPPRSAPSFQAAGADPAFATEAAVGGTAEVETGRLAARKATDERLRQFAQQMVNDHSRANEALRRAAAQEGITLPTALDEKHREALARLEGLSGDRFDEAYRRAMVEDHKGDVVLFQKEASPDGSPVQRFAAETLPTLKKHLEMIEQISAAKTNASR